MAYPKRRSATLEKAQSRLRGLQSVHSTLDLGNGLTLQSYADLIAASSRKLDAHNLALAEVDRTRIEFAEAEASVTALSSRVLTAVVALYGKDSKEYEMAGGKPLSSYKRFKKRAIATSVSDAQTIAVTPSTTSPNGAMTNGTASAT